MNSSGFEVHSSISVARLIAIHDAIKHLGHKLGAKDVQTIDDAWFNLDRIRAAQLYNAMKRHPLLYTLAADLAPTDHAVVDINFRIDAPGEDKFLFDWHQDVWYSMCSTNAVVAWIPLVTTDDELGGVELVPGPNRIYRARRGKLPYSSYANAVVLDEEVDVSKAVRPHVNAGEVLFFRFNVLHRSVPNVADHRCRWTVQVRYCSYDDPQFRDHNFKPGIVTENYVSYLDDK